MTRAGTIAVAVVAGAAALAAAGCLDRPAAPAVPDVPEPAPRLTMVQPTSQPASPDQTAAMLGQVHFQVFCDVLILEAPAESVSASDPLWRHLREDTLGIRQTDHLGRNGLRLGVGKAADFAEVTRLLLSTRDAKSQQGRMRFESESAMEVQLDPQVRARRFFVYSPDGAVSGDEYPAAVTFLWVGAWHDVERIDAVNLTLVPEIRHGRVRERYYVPTLQRTEQYRDVGRLFNELKVQMRLDRGEFLVLAPSLKANPGLVLGRALLTDQAKGQTRETVLLIRPRVVRTPRR